MSDKNDKNDGLRLLLWTFGVFFGVMTVILLIDKWFCHHATGFPIGIA